jgi:hypothetical protein
MSKLFLSGSKIELSSCFPHFKLSHPEKPLKVLKTLDFYFHFGWLGVTFEDVYPQKT